MHSDIVSRETLSRWQHYEKLLHLWQPKINLVSSATLKDAYQRHFLDSVQLRAWIPDREKRIIDLGSGAGFPGMVLAMDGYANVELIESDKRKAAFLHEVAAAMDIEVIIHVKRIEDMGFQKADIIVSRALAPLVKLMDWAFPFLRQDTTCLFHKGRGYVKEIHDAKRQWAFDHIVHQNTTDSEGVIVEIKRIRPL